MFLFERNRFSTFKKQKSLKSAKKTLYFLLSKIQQLCKLISKTELILFFCCKNSRIQSKKFWYSEKYNFEKTNKNHTMLKCKKLQNYKKHKMLTLKICKLLKFIQLNQVFTS